MQSYARKTGSKQSLLQKVSRNGPMVSAILLIVVTGVAVEVIPSNSSIVGHMCTLRRESAATRLAFRNKALFDGGTSSSRRERHDTSSKVHEQGDHISIFVMDRSLVGVLVRRSSHFYILACTWLRALDAATCACKLEYKSGYSDGPAHQLVIGPSQILKYDRPVRVLCCLYRGALSGCY